MGKFKVGDLALIVACRLPELIGKTVELMHQVLPGEEVNLDERNWINYGGNSAWVIAGKDLLVMTEFGNIEKSDVSFIAEHKLMPLRGDFQPEQQKAKDVEV